MTPDAVLELIGDSLIPAAQVERNSLDVIDKWLNDNPVEAFRRAHERPNAEKEALARLGHTPILRFIVEETAQQMDLEGVHSGNRDTTALWRPWERNGMPSRQSALWNASLGYGYAYTVTLPGALEGEAAAVIRAVSPRNLHAVYADPVEDEWPMYALRTIPQGRTTHYRLLDEEAVHYVARDESGALQYIEPRYHNVGVTPVVRWANGMDLEGRTPGEVDRHKDGAQRLFKTTHDRMAIQHHNSWRILTATGLEDPGTDDERDRQKTVLRNNDILTGGEGVAFSTLPETTLDSILKAEEADRDTIAAMSQTPVWALNGGQLVNLAADAISEARSTSRLKVRGKQRNMGRSAAQNLRLAAFIEGREEDASDFDLRAQWADVEARSLSQAADALGKIALQLKVPVEKLWDMIPGVSKATSQEWKEWAESHPSAEERMAAALERQAV